MAKGTELKDILWIIAIVVVAFPLVPLFDRVGRPEFERPAYFALMLMLIAVKVCRDLRGRLWFWIAIVAIAALHVPILIVTAQRLYRAPFSAMLFLAIANEALVLAIITLIERLIGDKDAPGAVAS